MSTKKNSPQLIAFCLFVIMQCFNAVGQNSYPMSESAIAKKTSENMSKGLDPYTGITSTFFITYQEKKIKDVEIDLCTNEINQIPGTTISFNTNVYQIKLSCPKDRDNKNFALYKEILAKYDIRILEDKEYLYETK